MTGIPLPQREIQLQHLLSLPRKSTHYKARLADVKTDTPSVHLTNLNPTSQIMTSIRSLASHSYYAVKLQCDNISNYPLTKLTPLHRLSPNIAHMIMSTKSAHMVKIVSGGHFSPYSQSYHPILSLSLYAKCFRLSR